MNQKNTKSQTFYIFDFFASFVVYCVRLNPINMLSQKQFSMKIRGCQKLIGEKLIAINCNQLIDCRLPAIAIN